MNYQNYFVQNFKYLNDLSKIKNRFFKKYFKKSVHQLNHPHLLRTKNLL
jgi:hypothetical protein